MDLVAGIDLFMILHMSGTDCSYKKSPSSMIVDFISFVGIISRYIVAYVCFSCSDGFYLLYHQSLTFTYWDATYIFSAK